MVQERPSQHRRKRLWDVAHHARKTRSLAAAQYHGVEHLRCTVVDHTSYYKRHSGTTSAIRTRRPASRSVSMPTASSKRRSIARDRPSPPLPSPVGYRLPRRSVITRLDCAAPDRLLVLTTHLFGVAERD